MLHHILWRLARGGRFLSMVFAALGLALSLALSAAETIAFSASTTTTTVGATFTVTVSISGASPFANWQNYVAFDPAKLQLLSQATGTFTTFIPDSRVLPMINATGTITSGGLGFADNGGGSGSLGVFTFTAVAAGSTTITTVGKSGGNLLGTALSTNASVERVPGLPGPLIITIGGGPTNAAPVVNVGVDKTVTLPATLSLTAAATDDGLPVAAVLSHQWTKTSGPGTVTFSPGTSLTTNATFSVAGVYVLRLTTNDTDKSGFDELQVTVSAAPINATPVVNAGVDKTITLPANVSLTGTATDDGLPTPATLSHQWSKISGPGTVTFSAATSLTTTVTFGSAGMYVLRLTTSDGALPGFDDVTVTVNAAPIPTVITSLSYVLSGPVPVGAIAVRVLVGSNTTTATLAGNSQNLTWTAAITAPVGTTVATVQFVAPDNSVKSRAFNLVR